MNSIDSFPQPLHIDVREILRVTAEGRSRPLFVRCEEPGGRSWDMVLKLRDPQIRDGTPWGSVIMRDLVGTMLARRLGLTCQTLG